MNYFEFLDKANEEYRLFLWQKEQEQKAISEMERLVREGQPCEVRLRKNFWIPGYFIRRRADGRRAVVINPSELPDKGTKVFRRKIKGAVYIWAFVQENDFRLKATMETT